MVRVVLVAGIGVDQLIYKGQGPFPQEQDMSQKIILTCWAGNSNYTNERNCVAFWQHAP